VKHLLTVTVLLLLVIESQSQTQFYPCGNGDYWIYWEYAQYGGSVWDTITTCVVGDSIIGGRIYKAVSHWSTHYLTGGLSFERVDSSGDVFVVDPATGQEALDYRLSDTSRSWWVANGYLQRFDSCVVKGFFGRPRVVLYVSAYRPGDTSLYSQRVLIDSIGFYTSNFYGLIDGVPTFLHEARIGGVLFSTPTDIRRAGDNLPSGFSLEQNFPNPFNPSTTIRYGLPNRSHVSLTVFNTLGQQVALLENGEQEAGYHEVKFGGAGLSSGLYFYRLQAGMYVETKKFALTK
jgi:hypothetical protein